MVKGFWIGWITSFVIVILVSGIFGLESIPLRTLLILLTFIIFFVQPINLFIGLIVNSVLWIFVSLGVHIYTVFIGFQFGLTQGFLTLFFPVVSQVYWLISLNDYYGSTRNPFWVIIVVYCFFTVQGYSVPIFLKNSITYRL